MAIDLRMSSASVIIPAAPTLASTHSRAPSERIKVSLFYIMDLENGVLYIYGLYYGSGGCHHTGL